MSGRNTLIAHLALVLVCAAPAHANDGDDITLEGLARVGWRLLHGDDEGRFRQDANVREGPLLLDLDARLDDLREDGTLDFAEVSLRDLGDRTSDGRLRVEGRERWRLDAGFLHDRFSYTASGDPFPRDTDRARYDARIRWSPTRGVTLRASWDRSTRDGIAYAAADTDIAELPRPAGVDRDIVGTRRPFEETFDTATIGADVATGGWRLGVTLSGRRGLADDERLYDVPAARRGTGPLRETFRRRAHVEGRDAVLKIGRSLLGDAIEAALIVRRGRHPVDADLGGASAGFDNAFEGTSARGTFSSTFAGGTQLERDIRAWELDTLWHATDAVDVQATIGQEEIVDDATLRLEEVRRYDRLDVGTGRTVTTRRGRTTQRRDRSLLEMIWSVTDDVRLRGGHETLTQDVEAPFETRADALTGSEIRSFTRRWIAGVDVEPVDGLRVSALARMAHNDQPAATPAPETADDVVARVRWRATDTLHVTAVGRHRGLTNDQERFDSAARSRSASLAATWAPEGWTVDASLTRQSLVTRTDTSFFVLDSSGFRQVRDTVAYRTRDLVASLHVTHEPVPGWRCVLGGHAVRSRGDAILRSCELRAGVAHDISTATSTGLDVRTWRYDERDRDEDDGYDATAVEIWFEVRFR